MDTSMDMGQTDGSAPTSGRIDGWTDFAARFSAGLAMAATQPSELCWSDPDFARWPLGERSTIEGMGQWARAHRASRCRVLMARDVELVRRHPRWLQWRRDWSHRVSCWMAPEDLAEQVPALWLWPGHLGLKVMDSVVGSGVWSSDRATILAWQADFDAISQRSTEGIACTTLGL